MRIALCILALLASAPLKAQFLDSLLLKKHNPRLILGLDGRTTLMQKEITQVAGVRTGLEWNERYRAGIGYYWLRTKVFEQVPYAADTLKSRLRMRYFAGWLEYAFIKTKRWDLSLPLSFGIGRTNYDAPGVERFGKKKLYVLEPGLNACYKVWPWMGIAGGAGYRHSMGEKLMTDSRLSGPYAAARLKIFIAKLYRAIRL